MNRLARESSPYLRQHMHNPVDWYPWGEEAFAAARATGRPILLSIGYSACHWCHVMERESFEDAGIAARMNEGFVNVKVDREERPDVDNIYQTAVQLLRRSGGWPLTAFLTPDGRPFFVGTYFPPEPRHGLPGFGELLGQVRAAWEGSRGEVDRSASALTEALGTVRSTGPRDELGGPAVVAEAALFLLSKVDPELGGFGTAPKFPTPTNLWTLWRHFRRAGDADARDAVLLTLRRMADGGMYDQLGGGFHRYSTDRAWHVPHFEKMLYDNALLVPLYLEAWRECAVGSGPRGEAAGLLAIARDTLTYLARDMRAPDGLFYAATDADSEGVEGRYFVWTPQQVRAALAGEDDADALAATVCAMWDVTEAGNWEGVAILRRTRAPGEVAAGLGIAEDELAARMARARPILLAARVARIPPLRDDKRLCSWNALAALAFLDGWRATGEVGLLDVAVSTVDALLAALVRDGRLAHSTCEGDVKGPGLLDDHAALGLSLVQVYEAGGAPRHLDAALGIAVLLDGWFGDGEGGWFQTPADGEALIVRPRDGHDSAVPSGDGLAAAFFARLAAVTGEDRWATRAEDTLRAHAGQLEANPYGAGSLLAVLDTVLGGWEEVVLAGEGPERAAMARVAGATPGLDRLVLDLGALPPGHPAAGGRSADIATAWVCRGRTCSLPIRSAEALRALLTA